MTRRKLYSVGEESEDVAVHVINPVQEFTSKHKAVLVFITSRLVQRIPRLKDNRVMESGFYTYSCVCVCACAQVCVCVSVCV